MRICLNLDPSRLLKWHLWVAETLAGHAGNEVFCRFSELRRPVPSACRLLFEVERVLYGTRAGDAAAPMTQALRALPDRAGGPADLTIDFAGDGADLPGRVLTPLFNGVPGEIGVIAALIEGRGLDIELLDSACPGRSWSARPASVDLGIVSASLDGALSCAVALIAKACAGRGRPAPASGSAPMSHAGSFAVASLSLARAAATVAVKATRLVHKLVTGGLTWRVGWRSASTALLAAGRASFSLLPQDPGSFYADPFPFSHEGRNYIFIEQFRYDTGLGCIAVVEVRRDGSLGRPRVVLEKPFHLSYPYVFERDGQIWMIPEAGQSGAVDLYRADAFPYRWTRAARLDEGRNLYDTTPLDHDGAVWFFTTLRNNNSSAWDMLGIYRSEGLTGRWTPHAENPVVIDAGLSRPAGAFIRAGGQILRPVQDCARYYGGAMHICRIDVLTETEFVQTVIGRIDAGRYGCHTYNRGAGIEVVDLFGTLHGRREVPIAYRPVPPETPAPPGTPVWTGGLPEAGPRISREGAA